MTHAQEHMRNPFGMDESCPNCPELVESRETIVHGYGDVAAEFLFVCEHPSAAADADGRPQVDAGAFGRILSEAGFLSEEVDAAGQPRLENAFVTHLTRCHHPDRPARDEEVMACEPFLNAEIRSINPELLIPVGQRPLEELAREYSTRSPDELEVADQHGEEFRGRGFEILPMVGTDALDEARVASMLEAFERIMGRDYRQTKGRQGR